jgi:O-antigen/teichoic acid export membrane protein
MPIRKLLSSRLRINMASSLATTVVNVAVTGIGYPVYLHFMGYEKYGVWLVLATIISFVQLTNLGIGSAVMKLVAEEHARGNRQGVQGYATTAMAALVTTGLPALLVLICCTDQIIALFNLKDGNAAAAAGLLPYVGALSVYVFVVQVFSATLSGLGRMDLANYTDSAGRILALGISVYLLYSGRGIESLFIGSLISYLLVHALLLYQIGKCGSYRFFAPANLDRTSLKGLLSYGSGLFGSSLVSMLLGPLNKLVLTRWVGVSSVPVYEIAFNGSMQIRSLFEAMFRAISPEVSRLSACNERDALQRVGQIDKRAARIIWTFGAPFWCFVIILAAPLLKTWLGGRFVDTLPPVFRILMVGTYFGLMAVPAFYILMGLGKTKQILVHNIIQSGLNATIVLLLLAFGADLTLNRIACAVVTSVLGAGIYLILKKNDALKEDRAGAPCPTVT